MTDDLWVVVPNWDKFQHYKDRQPLWIKLYTELSAKDEWRRLTLSERGLLCSLWVAYATSNGQLRPSDVPSHVAAKVRKRHLDSLQAAGFIQLSASKPLANSEHLASTRALARDREEKRHKDLAGELAKNARPQKPKPALTYCSECEVGGGMHAADCPTLAAVEAER